jgi:cytochrome c2
VKKSAPSNLVCADLVLLPAGLKKPEERANLIAYLKKATA